MAGEMEELYKKYPSLKKFENPDYDEWNDGREAKVLDFIYNHPSLPSLRGNPAKILAAMDDFATQQDFLISIGPHKAEILQEMIADEKPQVVVEFGGYLGYSAILFADAMRKNNNNKGESQQQQQQKLPRVWTLEASPLFAAMTMSFVDLAGLSDIVKVVTGKAAESLRRLHDNGEIDRLDWLFLDHVEELYAPDLKTVEELGLVKPGVTIIADNVVRPGAPEYREYVRSHPRLESEGVKGLIMPGEAEDELEVSRCKK